MHTITITHKVGNDTKVLKYDQPIAPEILFGIGRLIQSLYDDPSVRIYGTLDGVTSAIGRDGLFDEEDWGPLYDTYSFTKCDGDGPEVETWTFGESEVSFFL